MLIVPVPVTSAVNWLPENFTFTVSSLSTSVSPFMVTATVAVFCPTAKSTVPAPATKSSPAVAVPVVSVWKLTVVTSEAALSKLSVKARVFVPESPSVSDGESDVSVYFPA